MDFGSTQPKNYGARVGLEARPTEGERTVVAIRRSLLPRRAGGRGWKEKQWPVISKGRKMRAGWKMGKWSEWDHERAPARKAGARCTPYSSA